MISKMKTNKQREETDSRYKVPNLERALTILEFIGTHPQLATMAELTRKLGFPKNSVFRIVTTLEERGYLIRNTEGKRYQLSRKLLALGYQSLAETGLLEQARPTLCALRDELRETALLGTLLEGEGVTLDQMLSPEPVKVSVTPGTNFRLHTSAPGKAILAFLPHAEADRIIDGLSFECCTDRTITTREAFRQELDLTRAREYAIDCGEDVAGVVCVGAPVLDYRQRPVAAIWITGPEYRLPQKRFECLGDAVRESAFALSRLLGGL